MATLDLLRLFAGHRLAIATALIGNLIPVLGVALLGWSASGILILYWIENVILGALTVPRIIAAGRGRPIGLGLALFFIVHYGLFCLGHLVFVMVLVGGLLRGGDALVANVSEGRSFLLAILAIAALQLVSQIREWWGPKRWRDSEPGSEMFRPYGRIFILHLTVLLGAWLIMRTGAPTATILLLCVLKAVLELGMIAVSSGRKSLAQA